METQFVLSVATLLVASVTSTFTVISAFVMMRHNQWQRKKSNDVRKI